MKKIVFYLSIAAILLAAACSEETELKRSVFIPDDTYPDLPAYTEWGYNSFGAYYDMEPFISNDYGVTAKMINTGGKTSFTLTGHMSQGYNYYYYDGDEVSLIFDFYGFDPQSYTDLISLNDHSVNLTDPTCRVRIIKDTASYELDILSGTLFFKRAQNLYVDKKLEEVILSGTFGFQALVDGEEPISVSLGRFDVGIGFDNFFRY